jgi:hypothetical protein
MNPIESCATYCPWCGSPIDLVVDCSVGSQEYVEDCAVCCRPMIVTVTLNGKGDDALEVSLSREGD